MNRFYAVVIAGGQGTRLWPLSRNAYPKQFLHFAGAGRSLLQAAVDRAGWAVADSQQVLVVAPLAQAELIRRQLPELPPKNLILEPEGRNTAAAVGLAALYIQQRDPGAVMGVFPADHLFRDDVPWIEAVQTALEFAADSDHLVTIGLKPVSPSPSYGYLHLGSELPSEKSLPVFKVRRFVEKPAPEKAQAYLDSGEYLWNTGTFAWKTAVILREFERHLPDHFAGFQRIQQNPDSRDVVADVYASLENISIDYGVMEKSSSVVAVKADFERIDLGNLSNLSDLPEGLIRDADGNALFGESLVVDGRNNLIFDTVGKGMAVTFGLDDVILVRQADVVLALPKSQAHRVKDLLAELRQQGLDRYL